MAVINFPPIEVADEDGFLAIGGNLEVESLLTAYSRGIFPWPISEEYPLAWFSPNPRGVLRFEDLHISRSLRKTINKKLFRVGFNHNFPEVINLCQLSKNRKGQGTWITEEIVHAYTQLFYHGHAYSVEVYNRENQLVGGIYGVSIGSYFSGESMFFLEDNASKVALVYLMRKLSSTGINWLDTQMITPVLKTMGATNIDRSDFIKLLKVSKIAELPYIAGASRLNQGAPPEGSTPFN